MPVNDNVYKKDKCKTDLNDKKKKNQMVLSVLCP